MSTGDDFLLVGAGLLAGVVGTAGGITSLVSYPALLAVGISPLLASMTNIVALVACLPGSALSSRTELRGRAQWLRKWCIVSVAGGAAGAALLLSTPAGIFARVVPVLLVLAALSLLAQPRLSAWQAGRLARPERVVLPVGVFATSLYSGYFGAGSGVMTLALVLLAVDQHVARANALKNMLIGVATVVSAAAFVLFGRVVWPAAAALALGAFAGSTIGPVVARSVPGTVLRVLVALTGIGLAVRLWVAPS